MKPTALGRVLYTRIAAVVLLALSAGLSPARANAPAEIAAALPAAQPRPAAAADSDPLHMLGVGDLVAVQVFGRPEMNISAYVSDNGSITLPLVGAVQVSGLSPSEASKRVAAALRKGDFLLNPQVNMTLSQFHSQQVSVLGEVHTPGRYALETKTNIFDLLAQAGGLVADAADVGYLLRKDRNGTVARLPVDLKNLANNNRNVTDYNLKGGDSLYVPKSAQFYIYGEVRSPNRYKLERGMTVVEALALGGGVTDRGSERRIEIRRRASEGRYQMLDAKTSDSIQPDDVIRVKQRLF